MHYLRLFKVFFRTSVQTDMAYRIDFFTRVITSLLSLMTTVGGLAVAFRYTTKIGDWSFPQVMALLAIYYLMDGVIEMFIAPNMRSIMDQVRNGSLDFVLLKPVSSQFLATFRQINIWRIVSLMVGTGLLLYTLSRLSLHVGLPQAFAFVGTLMAGAVVVYSFWLCLVTLTFWYTRISNIEQLVWQAFEAGRYPIEIYPGWLRGVLTYVIPIAFIITVPAQALAGKIGLNFLIVAFAVSLIFGLLSSAFWRFGLKHYTGASS